MDNKLTTEYLTYSVIKISLLALSTISIYKAGKITGSFIKLLFD